MREAARATPSGKRPQLELPSPHTHKLTHHSKALALKHNKLKKSSKTKKPSQGWTFQVAY
ncbi:hypothetical protein CSV71_16525 [Sporosarcina sp. P21c]|nr:hypothetical protein SporoP8_13590 [Sporosarcina ureae]PIC87044.1 hypothetical protein CSV71_16525 [Sporosarcina sp. P21c]